MKLLENQIKAHGQVLGENILKVDSFLTHQVDPTLMREIAKRFAEIYDKAGITKIVTIEASGIAPALYTAEMLGLPMVFAKKSKNVTMNDAVLSTEVFSFTKQVSSRVSISRKFISKNDKILIIDDFLANGQAALGLLQLIEQAQAEVAGIGIVIEKSFQAGRQLLLDKGIKLTSLARIEKFEKGQVLFAVADDAEFDEK
ncbi:MAG: xanthine phosphoribosyltransferase [Streptococcaceae bacterium]|jgi:xanthine phosphoribosyltransferase|nr:xanthine phosphoribosyltransferase [Streptococcaceae bacterium]